MPVTTKLKLSQIAASAQAFQEVMAFKLPGKEAFGIVRLAKELDQHLNDMNNAREQLFGQHGFHQDGYNSQLMQADKVLSEEDKTALQKALQELANQEVTVVHEKLSAEVLAQQRVSPYTLAQLEWLFEL